MFKKAIVTVVTLLAFATPALAQRNLKAAVLAAMDEAIEEPRYDGWT